MRQAQRRYVVRPCWRDSRPKTEVRALYREREIARAKATERGNGFGHPAQEAL
jgi:hypothetical protein